MFMLPQNHFPGILKNILQNHQIYKVSPLHSRSCDWSWLTVIDYTVNIALDRSYFILLLTNLRNADKGTDHINVITGNVTCQSIAAYLQTMFTAVPGESEAIRRRKLSYTIFVDFVTHFTPPWLNALMILEYKRKGKGKVIPVLLTEHDIM